MFYQVEGPHVTTFEKFSNEVSPFVKEADRAVVQPGTGQREEILQGRKRSGGYNFGFRCERIGVFDSNPVDGGRQFEFRHDGIQKRCLLGVALHEADLRALSFGQQDRHNEPG